MEKISQVFCQCGRIDKSEETHASSGILTYNSSIRFLKDTRINNGASGSFVYRVSCLESMIMADLL